MTNILIKSSVPQFFYTDFDTELNDRVVCVLGNRKPNYSRNLTIKILGLHVYNTKYEVWCLLREVMDFRWTDWSAG